MARTCFGKYLCFPDVCTSLRVALRNREQAQKFSDVRRAFLFAALFVVQKRRDLEFHPLLEVGELAEDRQKEVVETHVAL